MLLQSRYEYDPKKDLLGKGGFARVYKARDTLLERNVAIKIFNSSGKDQYTVLNEIKKVIQFEHPNLLRYFDVILIEQENSLGESERLEIGVMELANAGDLKDFAKANPNSPILFKLLKDVLEGLTYLHQNGIIHRDLKAQNVLLVEGKQGLTAKISDFGISKDVSAGNQSSSMMVGTIEYMAPEQFSPQKYGIDGKIGSNVDLWSFGIMVHELITDSTPFGSRDGNTTAEQIMSSILSTEHPKDFDKLPEPYRTIVKKCLVANAKERIRKASELIQYFESNHSQSNSTTANDNQTTDEQATKVYGKVNDQSGNSIQNDEKTKVYGKSAQNQTARADDATKVYPKERELLGNNGGVGANKSRIRKAKYFLIITITLFSLSFLYLWEAGEVQTWMGFQQISCKEKFNWFLKGAEKGNAIAAESIGYIYDENLCESRDYAKAMEWYLKAANQNSSSAQYKIGLLYQNGSGTKQNIEEAKKWYQKATDNGSPAARETLKLLQTEAETLNKKAPESLIKAKEAINREDFKKAYELLLSAVKDGNSEAQVLLGERYEGGEGVAKDYKKAMDLYLKSAEQGNSSAQYKICLMYNLGLGVAEDGKKATEWCLKSAEQGNSIAQYHIGIRYQYGIDVPKDSKKALEWLLKAAQQNNSGAQYSLGEMYDYGKGVSRDKKKSIEWYLKAAEQNNSDAQFQMGYIYEHGKGVSNNIEEAKKWYQKAASQGHNEAMVRLENLP